MVELSIMKQWNRIFKKRGKVYLKLHESIPKIIKIFKKKNVKKVLDLGCGSGRHMVYLAKNGFDVSAFDLSHEGIEHLNNWSKEENLNIKIQFADMLSLPLDECYLCLEGIVLPMS